MQDTSPLCPNDLNRSCAFILGASLLDIFPKIELFGGGSLPCGFYYDFKLSTSIENESLPIIEDRMHAIARDQRPVESIEMMKGNTIDYFKHHQQSQRAWRLKEEDAEVFSLGRMDSFMDIIEPPLIENSKELKYFRLVSLEEVGEGYRIKGLAAASKQSFKKNVKVFDELQNRDLQTLGEEGKLFHIISGLTHWTPKGVKLKKLLERSLLQELEGRGFSEFLGPLEKVFSFSAGEFLLREENYKNNLPFRYFERQPRGEGWPESTAISFVSLGELQDELISSLLFIEGIGKVFGFESSFVLETQRQSTAAKGGWRTKATEALIRALDGQGLEYKLVETQGLKGLPRLNASWKDDLGVEWEGPRLFFPWEFPPGLEKGLIGENAEMRAIAIELYSSFDALCEAVIARYAGALPMRFAPEQLRIMVVAEGNLAAAEKLQEEAKARGIRVKLDFRDLKLRAKVFDAQREKIPYSVVIGDREAESSQAELCVRGQKEVQKLTFSALIDRVLEEESSL